MLLLLILAWHTNTDIVEDVEKFESEVLEKTRLLDKVDNVAISSHFGHIFGGVCRGERIFFH